MMDQQTDNVVVKNYNTFKNYLISSIIGVLISTYVIITSIKGYLDNGNQFSFDLLMTSFADGFFVSGVLIGGIGLLVLISGEGIFDIRTFENNSKFYFSCYYFDKQGNKIYCIFNFDFENSKINYIGVASSPVNPLGLTPTDDAIMIVFFD